MDSARMIAALLSTRRRPSSPARVGKGAPRDRMISSHLCDISLVCWLDAASVPRGICCPGEIPSTCIEIASRKHHRRERVAHRDR
jgi:hypothetical protein